MKALIKPMAIIAALAAWSMPLAAETLQQANERLFKQLAKVHRLSAGEVQAVKNIFAKGGYVGQGNPAIVAHPMTPEQCAARIPGGPSSYNKSRDESICGDKFMAPLYDPRKEKASQAKACIDKFEFPNIPCTYPVVWVKAREAAQICGAIGKRLCDAHEWEGACAGALEPPDYRFGTGSVAAMRNIHNRKYSGSKNWAYGGAYRKGVCAAASSKSAGCGGGGWGSCGSNTYPTGAFPNCVSKLGVYDIHGNAAEHMNLPMAASQMSSRGSKSLGVTEMKGSWFIFDKYYAHPDWCRWRAPFWHGRKVMSGGSHENYHLGFRCCKSVN